MLVTFQLHDEERTDRVFLDYPDVKVEQFCTCKELRDTE
jgi:hypothetical protein